MGLSHTNQARPTRRMNGLSIVIRIPMGRAFDLAGEEDCLVTRVWRVESLHGIPDGPVREVRICGIGFCWSSEHCR
jgi:hypothetical protein